MWRLCRCCIVGRCRGPNCRLALPAEGVRACISGSEVQRHHEDFRDRKLCDCLVLLEIEGGDKHGVAIELKGGAVDGSAVVEQLQGGADLMKANAGEPLTFSAVLVHAGGLRAVEIRDLRSRFVRFEGQRRRVLLGRCGNSLADVLRENGVLQSSA